MNMLHRRDVQAGKTAARWLKDDPVFLDTETTGMSKEDEIIEVAVCGVDGSVLLNTLVRPAGAWIDPSAMSLHGITIDSLKDAPVWPAVAESVRQTLAERIVVIFHAGFDMRMLRQSDKAWGLDWAWTFDIDARCAMRLAAKAYADGNDIIRLREAIDAAGTVYDWHEHRALDDARAMAALVKAMAEAWERAMASTKKKVLA